MDLGPNHIDGPDTELDWKDWSLSSWEPSCGDCNLHPLVSVHLPSEAFYLFIFILIMIFQGARKLCSIALYRGLVGVSVESRRIEHIGTNRSLVPCSRGSTRGIAGASPKDLES